jgi:adenine-specific DNA-methyltransferase
MPDIRQGDALALLRTLPDNSVDLIATDPPYYRLKKEAWDRAWDKPDKFLAWLDTILAEFQRVLRPNGSLYLFASPRMSARVEVLVAERFNVLSNIVWNKLADYEEGDQRATAYRARHHEGFRRPFDYSERIVFAEHHGFLFEPLRAYLDGEKVRAGFTTRQVAEAYQKVTGSRTVTGMAGHWFTQVQWALPTEKNYRWLRELFGVGHLQRPYDSLSVENEGLKQEYERLRRPFFASADTPSTDVWTFKTVKPYKGKHSCEKPLELMQHIIKTSSRPGAVVLDAFMGSGSTGEAALTLGRDFIGFDLDEHWVKHARSRCSKTLCQTQLFANAAD